MEKEIVQTSNNSMSERDANMKLWKEGMDAGDTRCALLYCTQLVDEDAATEAYPLSLMLTERYSLHQF